MKEQILQILEEGKKCGYGNNAIANELLNLFSVSDSTFERPNEPRFECPKCGCDTIDLPLKLTPRVDCGKPKCADCGYEFDR